MLNGCANSDPTTILCACAARIRVLVEKNRGPLELRRRQIGAASAAPDSLRAQAILADTVAGYASDLRAYAIELRPEVAAFESQSEAFDAAFSPPAQGGQPSSADACEAYVKYVKFARAEQQVVIRAADAFALPHAQPPGIEEQLCAVLTLFSRYSAALKSMEATCLSVLAAWDFDAPTR